jgi:large subunit ribosomal protein L19
MSKHSLIQGVEQQHMKKEVTDFRIGDTVSVSLRIIEDGGKERLQVFTGTVIARSGTGLTETFSVHRVAYNEGMERVFFLHSPLISGIEVIRRGQVRRSKLYYLRGTSGKASKVKGRFMKEKKQKPAASHEAIETAANVSA